MLHRIHTRDSLKAKNIATRINHTVELGKEIGVRRHLYTRSRHFICRDILKKCVQVFQMAAGDFSNTGGRATFYF
jgi:hypothetical protein